VSPARDIGLTPRARKALRSKLVRLVAGTALLAAAIPCGAWALLTWEQLEDQLERSAPLALEWSAEGLHARLEAAGDEAARIAADRVVGQGLAAARGATDPRTGELAAALQGALDGSDLFGVLLVVDPAGELLGVAGSTPGLGGVLEMLQPRSALEADLESVMRGASLRKELGSVSEPSVRVLEIPGELPLALGSAPLSSARGRGVLHGLVRREALAAALRSGPLGSRGRVALRDAGGREIAASGGQGPIPALELRGLVSVLERGWSARHEQPLEELGWVLVAETSLAETLHPLVLALATLLVAPAALASVFGALALVVGTRLGRPLWRLYEAMRKAALETELAEVDVPSAEGEARSLILAFNVTIRRLQQQRAEVERSQRALREQNQAFQAHHETLSKLTVTDPLTQLSNRRHLEEQLSIEVKRLSRHNEALSILVLDIDDFKQLNDRYGHAAGDEFLRQVARILRESVRATDLVARYGGEEFVVVATGTNLDGAVVLAEKLRMAVAEASFIVDETKRPRRATVSVGVAEYGGSQTELFSSADAALYRAKGAGKDCVVAARPGRAGPDPRVRLEVEGA
jgi:diguanylate cyclase (GGDEF)-like protein